MTYAHKRVLIVEDNEKNSKLFKLLLNSLGCHCHAVTDGAQGIAAALSQRPDLILMDMNLPVMDGWEAARHLKSINATHHIPIIALTAHAMIGDQDKALEAGCDDYATKPVDFPQLLARIHALLGERGENES